MRFLGVELAIAAGLESCLVLLSFALHIKWLFFFFTLFPGGIVPFLLADNVHDDSQLWLGVLLSWVFWTFVFTWLILRFRSASHSSQKRR